MCVCVLLLFADLHLSYCFNFVYLPYTFQLQMGWFFGRLKRQFSIDPIKINANRSLVNFPLKIIAEIRFERTLNRAEKNREKCRAKRIQRRKNAEQNFDRNISFHSLKCYPISFSFDFNWKSIQLYDSFYLLRLWNFIFYFSVEFNA